MSKVGASQLKVAAEVQVRSHRRKALVLVYQAGGTTSLPAKIIAPLQGYAWFLQ
jgi:hypothetical protein